MKQVLWVCATDGTIACTIPFPLAPLARDGANIGFGQAARMQREAEEAWMSFGKVFRLFQTHHNIKWGLLSLLFCIFFQTCQAAGRNEATARSTGSSTSGTSRINRCNQCTLLNYLWMWKYRHMKPPARACLVGALLPSFSSEHWLKHQPFCWPFCLASNGQAAKMRAIQEQVQWMDVNGIWSGFHTFAVLVGVLLPIRRLQDGLKNDLKRPMEFAGALQLWQTLMWFQSMFFLDRFLVIDLQIQSSLCKLFKQEEHGTLLTAQRKAYDQNIRRYQKR